MNTHPRLRWLIPALCLPLTAAMAQEVPPASSLPGSHRGAAGPTPMEPPTEVGLGDCLRPRSRWPRCLSWACGSIGRSRLDGFFDRILTWINEDFDRTGAPLDFCV